MKRYFIVAFCVILFIATLMLASYEPPKARAGDITPTGMSQKDLVAVITALANAVNELKTDLNATQAALDVAFAAAASSDNVAVLADNTVATNSTTFTTIVLSPRAGF